MGCDIHAFIQAGDTLRDGSAIWYANAVDVSIRRDYLLFLIMAGVRAHRYEPPFPTPMFDPRGLPKDVEEEWLAQRTGTGLSLDVQFIERWQADAHTQSWLVYEELVEVAGSYLRFMGLEQAKMKECPVDRLNPAKWLNVDLEAILSYMAVYVSRGQPMRLVFWFDN